MKIPRSLYYVAHDAAGRDGFVYLASAPRAVRSWARPCLPNGAAQTRTLTLRQALELALQQNPDMVIARLDQQRARDQVTINKDPFSPKVFAGSGLAWTYGFPSSIDGSAPSIMQARTSMAIFDKPQSYLVAQAKETLRGVGISLASARPEVSIAWPRCSSMPKMPRAGWTPSSRNRPIWRACASLRRPAVEEGQVLAIESRKADVAEEEAAHRVATFSRDLSAAERSLGTALGLAPGDRVRAADEQLPALEPPVSEEDAIAAALDNSPEVKRLESDLQAKTLEIKGYRAYRLPKADLVAQYSLLAEFNNYTEYLQSFSAQ